jgi:hypothetical protein
VPPFQRDPSSRLRSIKGPPGELNPRSRPRHCATTDFVPPSAGRWRDKQRVTSSFRATGPAGDGDPKPAGRNRTDSSSPRYTNGGPDAPYTTAGFARGRWLGGVRTGAFRGLRRFRALSHALPHALPLAGTGWLSTGGLVLVAAIVGPTFPSRMTRTFTRLSRPASHANRPTSSRRRSPLPRCHCARRFLSNHPCRSRTG